MKRILVFAAAVLLLAACPRKDAAEPAEVEIEWPDAGFGSPDSPSERVVDDSR